MSQKKKINIFSLTTCLCCFYTTTTTTTTTTVLRPPGLCLGLPGPGCAGTRNVKPIWILLKQKTVNDSGISWATCRSAPRHRQITTPAPRHHSVFYRPDALPATQLMKIHVDCRNCWHVYWWTAVCLGLTEWKVCNVAAAHFYQQILPPA